MYADGDPGQAKPSPQKTCVRFSILNYIKLLTLTIPFFSHLNTTTMLIKPCFKHYIVSESAYI